MIISIKMIDPGVTGSVNNFGPLGWPVAQDWRPVASVLCRHQTV